MFCSRCGKQAEGEYCWNCGAKLYKPETEQETPKPRENSVPAGNGAAMPEVCRKPVSFTKFRATRRYNNVRVQFDDVHQIAAVGRDGDITDGAGSVIYLRYSEITGAEVKCTYEGVSRTSTGSMIGRAAVGSLFSPGAAIVGGATAKRVEKQNIESMSIHITTSNVRYPLVRIEPLSGIFLGDAELVCGILRQAMLLPPSEEAFELTEKWGAGNAPLKADSAPGPASKASGTALEPWLCTECCYRNPASSSTCRNCSAPKGRAQGGSALSALAEETDEASPQDTWFCSKCDYKNKGGKSCRSCGASRPENDREQGKKPKGLFGKIF